MIKLGFEHCYVLLTGVEDSNKAETLLLNIQQLEIQASERKTTTKSNKVYIPGIKGEAAAAAKSLQSCPTLCDPRDGSPPGSPIPGILQARVLEWGAIAFSKR